MSFTQEEKDEAFFIEDTYSSDSAGQIELSDQKHQSSCKRAARLHGERSPPLLLAFTISSGRCPEERCSPGAASQEEEEDSDQSIEEWMILGGEEELEDSSIQLNLGYWSSSEDDSGDEDSDVKSVKDAWAVSEKDKSGTDQSMSSRYFVPGHSLICHMCNRTGHLAKSCYYHKKCPTCILCGIKGHNQKDCPSRPCLSCGLPSHGLTPCENPPVWNQHCQRCGMIGHLCEACPDTWRQYHLTIQLEVPFRPQTTQRLKHKRHLTHCYNCSKRGHYGYECTKSRMVSRTFPSLPYVCHYDTIDDILECCPVNQRRAKELVSTGSKGTADQQHLSEITGLSGEENQSTQGKSRTTQNTCRRAGRRKTWPQRRRERQEIKRLRREAQARREGGQLKRSRGDSDDNACHTYEFKPSPPGHWKSASLPWKKKKRDELGGKRSRRSSEGDRWKKRGGIKRRDLYPHGNIDIESGNLLSPKQRVRHRRR